MTLVAKLRSVHVALLTATLLALVAGQRPATAQTTCVNGAALGIVLVIDDSGSMSGSDPGFLRLAAARLAIDQLPNQDLISVVKFDHAAYSVVEPTELSSANRAGLKQAVDDSPFFAGGTTYGPAFVQAKSHLAGMSAANKAVIFLSDGDPVDPSQEEHLSLGVPVFTVGLGFAPGDILTAIADQTGATYRAAQDAAAVQSAFSAIVSTLRCESAAGVFDDVLRPGEVAEHPIDVPPDAAELRATATWSLGQFRVDLIEPSGVRYGPEQSYPPGITYTSGGSYVTFGAQSPATGGWRIRVEALPGTPPDGVRVTSQITLRSGRTTAPPPVGPPPVGPAAPQAPQPPAGRFNAPAANVGWNLGPKRDRQEMDQWCAGPRRANNLIMVFALRGSGEELGRGTNRIRDNYYPKLAERLAQRGYRVYGFDGLYPAQPVPGVEALFRSSLLDDYIRSAAGYREVLSGQLSKLMGRCDARGVIVVGYSQGGIAARVMIDDIPDKLIARIRHVDLIADAAALPSLDKYMPRSRVKLPPPRRATTGIWALALRGHRAFRLLGVKGLNGLPGRHPAYPISLQRRTSQFCYDDDPVCNSDEFARRVVDAGARCGSILGVSCLVPGFQAEVRQILRSGGETHTSHYPFATIGAYTAAQLPAP